MNETTTLSDHATLESSTTAAAQKERSAKLTKRDDRKEPKQSSNT